MNERVKQYLEDKRAPLRILGLVAVACVLLFGIASVFGGDDEPDGPDLGAARVVCEDAVRDRLVNPSTADFQRPSSQSATLVRGQFTSENKLGGKVTMKYACVMSGQVATSVTVDER